MLLSDDVSWPRLIIDAVVHDWCLDVEVDELHEHETLGCMSRNVAQKFMKLDWSVVACLARGHCSIGN